MFALLLFLAADPSAVAAAPPARPLPTVEPDAMHMKPKEIREFNEGLPKNHPFYIRCKSHVVIGSLIAEARSCRTNHQWDAADAVGTRDARDTFEAMQGKAMPGN